MSVNITVASTRSISPVGRWPVRNSSTSSSARPSTQPYVSVPGYSANRAPGMSSATSRPTSTGMYSSSVWWLTNVGTLIVGSTALRSVSLIISISWRAMPGLTAERCIRAHHSAKARLPS